MKGMVISLEYIDIEQVTQDFQQKVGGDWQQENREIILSLPTILGPGYLRAINLRDGLDLFIYEHDLKKDLFLDFRHQSLQYSLIDLSFCVAGHCTGTMHGINHKIAVSAQETIFSIVPYTAGTSELLSDQNICVVDLVMSPTFMLTLMENNLSALPIDWQQSLKSAASIPHFQLTHTTPEIARILQLILHCPYQGSIRQIYLEGKVLELIALYFAQLADHTSVSSQFTKVKRKDFDSLHQAKNILLQNMDNPPSLAELARLVGINERKLQQGFQKLFGTTVFGVLHDYRMDQARQLLEADQMTVGAIANAVGISHRGYFATAFKRKFGSTPREYLKRLGG